MDYISKISVEEQGIICELMGGTFFKELFAKNSKEFNKIKPGFRVNTLTAVVALNTAKKAINASNSGFVRDCVNGWVKQAIREINECIENFKIAGKTHNEAISLTLIDSFFINDIELFFKLCDEEITKNQLSLIEEGIEKEKLIRSEKSNTELKIKALEDKIKKLEKKLENKQFEYDVVCSEKESEVSKYERKINELAEQLANISGKLQIAEEKNNATSPEIIEEQQLIEFEDKIPVGLPKINSEETISLCEVSIDYNGSVWLIRKADIDYEGNLSIYIKDESRPHLFDNRDKLFQKDGPTTVGEYAIWNWSTVPNNNDPSKDYVYTKHNPLISAIEIIVINNCVCLEDLIKELKNGVEIEIHSSKVMFSIFKGKGQYEGILFTSKEFTNENGEITLSKSATSAPVYEFTSSKIKKLDSGKMFYKTVFAGIPKKVVRLKSALEVVKEVVLNSISWNNYKTRGVAKAEYKCFKSLVGSIPSEDIIKKVAAINHCSIRVASDLLEQFILNITEYLNESCFEDEIITSALTSNEVLMNRAKSLIMDEWKRENAALLNDAERELSDVTEKVVQATEELTSIQASREQIKKEAEAFSLMISEKEKLALEVETAVADKIRNAQINAADFIANMAFISPSKIQLDTITQNANSVNQNASYEVVKQSFNIAKTEKHHKWKDVIDTVSFELEEAGVSVVYSTGLATYLCAAFIAKEPQIIIGPNARNIIEAFNAALFGDNLGVLKCDGAFTYNVLTDIGKDNEQIVMVNNILSKEWIERITDVFSKKDIMFIATHPFTEDIQVEPKSIYNYMLPLFTEFFVDKKSSDNYCGGYFANDFVPYAPSESPKKESKIVSSLNINKLIKGKIQNIISIMSDLNASITKDEEFIFGLLQYAYATADYTEINEAINNSSYSISNRLKTDIKFVLGEIYE